jgi:hypothetical protein
LEKIKDYPEAKPEAHGAGQPAWDGNGQLSAWWFVSES